MAVVQQKEPFATQTSNDRNGWSDYLPNKPELFLQSLSQ